MSAGTSWMFDGKAGREEGRSGILQEGLTVCEIVKTWLREIVVIVNRGSWAILGPAL